MTRVIIDAGHGGTARAGNSSAFGARGAAGTIEKDVTLDIARHVVKRLGNRATLTRTSDVNLTLGARAARAARDSPGVFISIHANSGPPDAAGPETFVHPAAGPDSRQLAQGIQRALGRLRGRYGSAAAPRTGRMAVLDPRAVGSGTSACLVEVDYLSNPESEQRLRDPAQRAAIGAAIASAIQEHVSTRPTRPSRRAYGDAAGALDGSVSDVEELDDEEPPAVDSDDDAEAAAGDSAPLAGDEFDELGQARSDVSRALICDLSSPIVEGSQPRYRLEQYGAELWSADASFSYRWTMTPRAGGAAIFETDTTAPEVVIPASPPGRYRVEVVVLDRGAPSAARMSLDLDVIPESADLTAGLAGTDPRYAQTMRELINDFRQYIIDGATATGPDGVTPLLLASILVIEIMNRPKDGRESELQGVDDTLSTLEEGDWTAPWSTLDHSLGVGQVRQSTAAMVAGLTPWIDQDRSDRDVARDKINANFDALPLATKRTIFTRLRWPKSNIALAAQLLAILKNRTNRYPGMTGAQFAADANAVGVVATEYNSGGTDTPAAKAAPANYGRWVWDIMQDPLLQQFFANS